MWQELSDVEWRGHELNRFRGWLLVVILFNCLGIVALPALLWVIVAYSDAEISLVIPGRPVLADAFDIFFGMTASVACLFAIWTRQYRAPEIYLATTCLVVAVQIGIEVIWSDSEFSAALFLIVTALFVGAPVMYLFRATRPNVMLKRRIHSAA